MAVYFYTLLCCACLLGGVFCIPQRLLYEYNTGEAQQLPREDDVSSSRIHLKAPVVFYGNSYNSIFVNSNGVLSFLAEIPTFLNTEFPLPDPVIAPFYSNVDTRGSGTIYYLQTEHSSVLQRATKTIHDTFSTSENFQATNVFIATWENVGYHQLGSDKVNTYQVVVTTDGYDTYVEFIYPEGGLQWIQGSGDRETGLPDARAQAGFISPDGKYFTLPGSGTDQVMNLDKWSNMNVPGQWIFRVGLVDLDVPVEEPDKNNDVGLLTEPASCASASTYCHSQATCKDYEGGVCCQCNEGYYGNGKNCIKRDVPLRVNGKVTGKINNIPLNVLDLQSYVVMNDARAYTAISNVPTTVGSDIQSLHLLGAVIGWVFAKPSGDALNGYQLTGGVFNHSATIYFTNTSEQVTIRQKYVGLDVFDQLKIEADVNGNLPVLPDTPIRISDYQEQYTVTSAGVVQSSSSHYYTFGDEFTPEVVYAYRIEQNFQFDSCKFDAVPAGTTWNLKSSRHYVGYDGKEMIIRYGMTNKIGPLGDTDPCSEGRANCGPNSACIVDGDSYQCACYPGFQNIYRETQYVCSDINECQSGLHDCDVNAQCVNEIGRYYCQCNPGFEGDGRSCRSTSGCAYIQCPEYARCVEQEPPRCECVEGFTGDGRSCTPVGRESCHIADDCSPYGVCGISEETQEYSCSCLPGYEGDGYDCTRTAATPTTTEYDGRVEPTCIFGICVCSPGYVLDQNVCTIIPTTDSSNSAEEDVTTTVSNLDETCRYCHRHAQCLYAESINGYYCACLPGFEGDGRDCRAQEVSCALQNLCHSHAACIYDEQLKKSVCVCGPGYEGDGFSCQLTATCSSAGDCPETEECLYVSTSQRYECICKEGLVRDSQRHCVKLEGTCNGGICVENAECLYDEQYQTNYCSCKPDFVGDGITECRPRPIGCNVVNNCGLNAFCAYDHQYGIYQCKCTESFFGDGFICYKEKDCHIDPMLCDAHAMCVTNASRKYVCECNYGYTGNGTICKENPRHDGNFLLLNQGMATFRIPFDASKMNPGKLLHLEQQMAIGLGVDCLAGRVYWSDINSHAIKSISYNGSGKVEFTTHEVGSPEGLSIDWVSRNIYWTDSTKDTIEVANLETKLRRTLFNTDLVNPRGIAVHPQRGKIFWSDWDRRNPKIEWANADGTQREIFLQGESVQLPNSLVIDFDSEQLCYADAGAKKIICVDIDTRQTHTLAVNCTYPFGIAVTDRNVFWSDWITKKIEKIDKQTLQRLPSIPVPLGLSGKVYGLVAVPEQCPVLTNVCQFYKDQCPSGYICLPNGRGSRNCVCGYKADSPLEKPICNY